jgi:phage baseplate assembly protein W
MSLGTDFSGALDLDPRMMQPTSERLGLLQALVRRLDTSRGALFYDPSYGSDLKQYLASAVRPQIVEQVTEAECLKDERVRDCAASAVLTDGTLTVRVNVTDAEGPFEFTLTVGELTVDLLLSQG